MKKVFGKTIIISILALTVLIGLHTQPVQLVKAVEVQPGSTRQPEPSGQTGNLTDEPIVAPGTSGQSFPAETGLLSNGPAADEHSLATRSDKLPALEDFITSVIDGQAGTVRGLYIPGLIALRIVPQPDGQFDFISYEEDTATQFQSPTFFGVIGLLAHNFLSGRFFLQVLPGQVLTIIYGNGQMEDFQVAEIHDYERLTELDLHSNFQDVQNNQTLSADQVFQLYYQGAHHLTLQTCLEKGGDWNWGVRMITAFPVSAVP